MSSSAKEEWKCTQASAQKWTEVTKYAVSTQNFNCTLTKWDIIQVNPEVSLHLWAAFHTLVCEGSKYDILYLCPRIQKCKCSISPVIAYEHEKCKFVARFTSSTNNKDGCEYLGAKCFWSEQMTEACVHTSTQVCLQHQKLPEDKNQKIWKDMRQKHEAL